MSPTVLSTAAVAAGLVALAGGLYALQRLRVRHREVVVVTTMFWREELQEQRARTLVERFRHPLTYALCLAIAGLMWLGVAGLDADRSKGEQHVLLLDGSAAMVAPGRFDAAREALVEEAARCPRDRTEVLFCGADVRQILAPGEDKALLGERLAALRPEAAGESFSRVLRDVPDPIDGARYVLFGDARPGRAVVDALPEGARVEAAELAAGSASGPRVVTLGVAPARSGAWGKADVLVAYDGADEGAPPTAWRLGGEVLGSDGLGAPVRGDEGIVRVLREDVPLDGRVLEVATGDGVDPRASATLSLPERPRLRVALQGDVPPAVTAALVVDPAVELVSTGADLHVGALSAGQPGIALVSADGGTPAILVEHDPGLESGAALARAVGELGLDRIDGRTLANRTGRTIAVGAAPAEARRVSLWRELFDADAGFAETRALPLVLARALRWAADVPPLTPYAAAGEPAPRRASTPPSTPRLSTATDGAGLLSLAPADVASDLASGESEGPGPWRPGTWVLLVALLLLCAEWVLHRKGRIA